MTKRHYFTSLGILLAALFYVKTVLGLHWWEAFGLVILAIVCVVHSIDVMKDIDRRKREHIRHDRDDDQPDDPIVGCPTDPDEPTER